jgi:hypothetical protein
MKRKYKIASITITVLILMFIVGQVVYAINKEPGSNDDPLVTLSFVEQRVEQLKFYIDEKIAALTPATGAADNNLVVVELKAGERLIAAQGTEIILRGGKALVIDNPLGGLADVTAAKDLRMNQVVPPNHLLIVPRDDGRGVKAENNVILIVRGAYRVEKQQ